MKIKAKRQATEPALFCRKKMANLALDVYPLVSRASKSPFLCPLSTQNASGP